MWAPTKNMTQDQVRRNFIALIGVDGSGKSTVIDEIVSEPKGHAKEIHCLRVYYRNYRNQVIWNHSHPPRGMLISMAKLFLKASVWWLRYHVFLHPLLVKGDIILCDRFYFDDIVIDPIKYRYGGSIALACKIRNRLPSPGIYILLDAPAETLIQRKKEATLDEVEHLRHAYLELIQQKPLGYVVDASAPISEVVEEVRNIIQKRHLLSPGLAAQTVQG